MLNIVGYTLFLSSLTTFMVWISIQEEIQSKIKKIKILIRTFLFSLVIMFIFVYFTTNDPTDDVIHNMNKGRPDF